ncbi:MAG: M42 family metallopeptidase [Anaerolineaceae bacterium]|nr:M42 family metallopeptidase [Anaerolineaceae bacterium]
MPLPPVDLKEQLTFLEQLLQIPSPTGYTHDAVAFVENALKPYTDLTIEHTKKGALLVTWPGMRSDHPRALTAHLDTLGAMVKEVKSNGRLKLSQLGGYAWNSVEGEGCTIYLQNGETLRGSILINKSSAHVYGEDVEKTKRDDDNMEVRLDIKSSSKEETLQAGVLVGDYISFDPRVEINNGFVRSRHLDDKACVANIVYAVKALLAANLQPAYTTYLYFSNFEEVGHGASSGIPAEVDEIIAVDMAAVGEGQTSDEFNTTLCVKDSRGPYHHDLSNRMRRLASQYEIPYKVDIYPHYGSDGEAFLFAGGDAAVCLIGPGVDASHSYERTHADALLATTKWLVAYLIN